ncbi:MAG: 50S ribosomal protein L10 [Acidimicrobiia bacterium]
MPRPEKVQAVAEIKERMEGAQAVFLAEYAGLSVKQQQDLRRELRANGAEFKVVKMTLARLAADDLDVDSLDELLLGPTGLAFADEDPASAAKVLKDFSKENDVFVVKGGLLGSEFLTPEKISELADLEPREVLLAKLAGAMQAPMSNLAGLLAALPRNTASVFQQLLEQKEASEGTEASSSDDAADEAPEAEAEAPAEGSEDDTADAAAESSEDTADVPEDEADVASESDESEEEAAEEAPAEEASADEGDEAEEADTDETEDDSEATVEASDDDDETKEDEAASDDAAEEK